MAFRLGKDISLDESASGVPKMGETLQGWFQPMTFTKVTKSVVNYQNRETYEDIKFRGVWQPYTAEDLRMVPSGQRSWRWFRVHSEIALELKTDEIILYKGLKYRVMSKLDYTEYDYLEYNLVEDYRE